MTVIHSHLFCLNRKGLIIQAVIIREPVEKRKLEFNTHMHLTFSVLCQYGVINCDKSKNP